MYRMPQSIKLISIVIVCIIIISCGTTPSATIESGGIVTTNQGASFDDSSQKVITVNDGDWLKF